MPGKRPTIPQRLRFEVFKRDKFACQYCGRGAPEIVLHCDHLEPVARGGTTDLLNLITSCADCNGGKGAVPLSDWSAIDKQRAALVELEERRQQLEMLLEWRSELESFKDATLDALVSATARGGRGANDNGRANLRKWLRKYPVDVLLKAIDESFDTYCKDDDPASWEQAFSKIPVFARIIQQEAEKPYIRRLIYIQAILRRRTGHAGMLEYLESLVQAGASIDAIHRSAADCDYITHFTREWDSWLAAAQRSKRQ